MRNIFILSTLVLLSSCRFMGGERVSGNGHITTQQKSVGNFNRVDVSGSVTVHIIQDAGSSVRIETDENLMPYVEVTTEGNKLIIKTKNGYNLDPSKDVIAYVSAPSFEDIDVTGACDIIGDHAISGSTPLSVHVSGSGDIKMEVDLPRVSTEISGSGTVILRGKAQEFSATINGSGNVKCFDLQTESTKVDLAGSADAEVNAEKELEISVSGSGDVRYKGSANVNQSVSGSGSVKKVG